MSANATAIEPKTADPSVKDLLIVQLLNQRDTAEGWVTKYQQSMEDAQNHLVRNQVKLAEVKALLALLDPDIE